jgi:hypothetical protein
MPPSIPGRVMVPTSLKDNFNLSCPSLAFTTSFSQNKFHKIAKEVIEKVTGLVASHSRMGHTE